MKHETPKMTTIVSGGPLTSSYAAQGDILANHGRDQILLFVNYTKGDETSMELEIQLSDSPAFAAADTYQDVIGDVNTSTGVVTPRDRSYTFTATTKKAIPIAAYGTYWRVRAKATAGTPTGTITLKARQDVVQK